MCSHEQTFLLTGASKDSKTVSSGLKAKRPASESLGGIKKEGGLGGASLLGVKKPKLSGQTFTPLGRADDRGRASPSTHTYHYDEIAKEGRHQLCLEGVTSERVTRTMIRGAINFCLPKIGHDTI